MFVAWMVRTTDEVLESVAQSQFGAIASGIGGIVWIASALLAALVFINAILQIRSIDGRTAAFLFIRITLISLFAFNWVEFNTVANAIIDGLNRVGGVLVSSVGGVGGSFLAFAEAFDEIMVEFADYLNAAGENMNWMAGAILGILGAGVLGILGALCGGILIFAKIMITFMLGIAPLMIAASLFEVTKDFFQRWLSATLSYALYPVVIAGVFSTLVGMVREMIDILGDPSAAGNLGALVPFFTMIVLAMGLMAATPMLVRSLSGNLSLVAAPALGRGSGALMSGLFNSRGFQARAAQGAATPAAHVGRMAGKVAVSAGQRVQRIAARSRRTEE